MNSEIYTFDVMIRQSMLQGGKKMQEAEKNESLFQKIMYENACSFHKLMYKMQAKTTYFKNVCDISKIDVIKQNNNNTITPYFEEDISFPKMSLFGKDIDIFENVEYKWRANMQ